MTPLLNYAGLKSSAGLEALIGAFGELTVGQKKDDVNIKFIYPFYNTTFDMAPAQITGDGAATVDDSLLKLTTTTGSVFCSSKNSIRYRSGHTGYADLTLKVTGETGFGEGGCFDTTDGYFVRYDNDTSKWSVGRRKGGIDFTESQEQFDGTINPNEIDPTNLNIFRVVFGYLGIANPVFMVKKDQWFVFHVLRTEGRLPGTTVGNPNFPVSVYAEGGATVHTASWAGGVIDGGSLDTGARFFSEKGSGTLSGTNLLTLGTFRNKTTYKTLNNKVRAFLLRYEFLVDAPATGYGTVEFEIIKNAVLSGVASYADLDADNSVMEVDTVQAYSSGGKTIFTEYVQYSSSSGSGSKSGGSAQLPAIELGLYLLPGETATITAKNVSGTTNVVVRYLFNHAELF